MGCLLNDSFHGSPKAEESFLLCQNPASAHAHFHSSANHPEGKPSRPHVGDKDQPRVHHLAWCQGHNKFLINVGSMEIKIIQQQNLKK